MAKKKDQNIISSMAELRKIRENYRSEGDPSAATGPIESTGPNGFQKEDVEAEGLKIKMAGLGGTRAHIHTAEVDEYGNGKTRRTFDDEPHSHDISNGEIQEGGVVPHTHKLEEP